MVIIRPEQLEDIPAIHHVNSIAFGQRHEADLVDALRRADALIISLVAVQGDHIIGHITFSPVTITSETAVVYAIGLAPMAVLPEHQRTGIGSQLAEASLNACREMGYGVVVVLGHPDYYPRFGFTPSKPYGITWEHDAPDEAFMVKELQEGVLPQTHGVVRYRPEFDVV